MARFMAIFKRPEKENLLRQSFPGSCPMKRRIKCCGVESDIFDFNCFWSR